MVPKLKILFLGAGKLLTLLEYFATTAKKQQVEIELLSFELSPVCAISQMATIIQSPLFTDPKFPQFLIDFVKKNQINIVIPTMDSATVALSSVKQELSELGCTPLVSEHDLCVAMNDKFLSEEWFKKNRVPCPPNTGNFPKIAKPRFGYASKGIVRIKDQLEWDFFARKNDPNQYLIQDLIDGDEYTVDAYVNKKGRVVDIMTRKRIEVEAGIVNTSLSHRNESILLETKRILELGGWHGPITLQFFYNKDGPAIIEINPRFGGGVTHSLHCGLDMPSWLINEHLGKTIEHTPNKWKDGSLMIRCRRDTYHDNCG